MIGKVLLRARRFFSINSLPGKFVITSLYYISEFESLILRPGQDNRFRRLFLRLKGVVIGKHCFMSDGFRLYKTQDCDLIIGNAVSFGENTGIYVHAGIRIGDNFIAAPGLTINNGTHDLQTMIPSAKPISIGDRVWCGVNVTIVAGAKIGDDCVIGANSLVMSEIPPDSLAYGVPARVVRKLNRSELTDKPWHSYQ